MATYVKNQDGTFTETTPKGEVLIISQIDEEISFTEIRIGQLQSRVNELKLLKTTLQKL